MRRLRDCLLVLWLTAVVTACQTPPPRAFADLRYAHLPPIRLNVASIDVVQQYKAQTARPHVEARFPLQPAAVAAQWAHDRLQAAGGPNILRATVLDGTVIEVPLKRTQGLRGVLTKDQSERYDAVLEMKLQVLAPDGRELASVSSRATRSRSVPEDITLGGREQVWFAMTEAMMNDINASLERQIGEHFGPWRAR